MTVYRYKDMRVRYTFMLFLSCIYFISMILGALQQAQRSTASLDFTIKFYFFLSLAPLILIFISVRALCYKADYTEISAIINRKYIVLDHIQSIDFNDNQFTYTIKYDYRRPCKVTIGRRESDADIQTFRQAMRELMSRVRQRNPSASIGEKAFGFATPGTKVYADTEESIRAERAKLTGIGGWLLYLAFDMIMTGVSSVSIAATYISLMFHIQSIGSDFWGSLIYTLVSLSYIPFVVMLLVSFFQKRALFQQGYITFLAYQLVASRLILILRYCLIDGKWPSLPGIIGTFVVGTVTSIVWLFAWKEYFKRSIRVRNTFVAAANVDVKSDS